MTSRRRRVAFDRVLLTVTVFLLATQVGVVRAGVVCDGTWYVTPTPNPGPRLHNLNAVDVAPNGGAWAVGSYITNQRQQALIVHWDGSAWAPTPFSLGQDLALNDVVSITATDAWAVGQFRGRNPMILHWDGAAWQASSDPSLPAVGDLAAISASGPGDVWAVGTDARDDYLALVAHWNGSGWSVVPPPETPDDLTAVEAIGPDDVWVAGRVANEDTDASAHWDGHSWQVYPFAGFGSDLTHIEGLTSTPDGTVWGAGVHYPVEPYTPTVAVIERWTGNAWAGVELLPLSTDSSLGDIAWTGDALRAVGWVKAQGSPRRTLILRRTPSGWEVEPSPTPGLAPFLSGVEGRLRTTLAVGWYVNSSGFRTLALHRCTS